MLDVFTVISNFIVPQKIINQAAQEKAPDIRLVILCKYGVLTSTPE
jgi:hypothetical protein